MIETKLIVEQQTEEVPFDESRYLNSHTDYEFKKKKSKWIHKSYIEPNNKLSIYKTTDQNGVLTFKNSGIHKIKYVTTDAYGNSSTLNFNITSTSNFNLIKKPIHKNFVKKMEYHLPNEYNAEGFLIQLPDGALYNDIDFKYTASPHPKKRWSDVHKVHSDYTPIHKPAEIFIKCNFPSSIPSNKLLAIRKTSKGRIKTHVGEFAVGYYSFKTKYFGEFYIYHDTVPPKIIPLNISNGKNIATQSKFDFKISDNLAGIKNFNCYIDGKWVLMEYDYKKARITHYKHNVISKGKHELKLVVQDKIGNESLYKCSFYN